VATAQLTVAGGPENGATAAWNSAPTRDEWGFQPLTSPISSAAERRNFVSAPAG
jgi:hypothetical protein